MPAARSWSGFVRDRRGDDSDALSFAPESADAAPLKRPSQRRQMPLRQAFQRGHGDDRTSHPDRAQTHPAVRLHTALDPRQAERIADARGPLSQVSVDPDQFMPDRLVARWLQTRRPPLKESTMKLLQTSLLASAIALAVGAGIPSNAHAVDALEMVNATLDQASDLAALPRQQVTLVRPPFVHDHDQVAKGGPKVVQFTLPIVEKEIVIDDQGTTMHAMTFGGSIPGPLMVVHEGDY